MPSLTQATHLTPTFSTRLTLPGQSLGLNGRRPIHNLGQPNLIFGVILYVHKPFLLLIFFGVLDKTIQKVMSDWPLEHRGERFWESRASEDFRPSTTPAFPQPPPPPPLFSFWGVGGGHLSCALSLTWKCFWVTAASSLLAYSAGCGWLECHESFE